MRPLYSIVSAFLLLSFASPASAQTSDQAASQTWATYAGDEGRSRYSALDQIHRENVRDLEVAWTFRTGDAREGNRSTIECNPIVVGGTMYVTSPRLKVFALDAATGQARWSFDPAGGGDPFAQAAHRHVNRGVTHWQGEGEARILFTAGTQLYALDAATGRPAKGFGKNGTVDLREGLGRDTADVEIWATSPGTLHENLLILGSSTSEGPRPAAPGHVRAYDVRTGEIAWTFRTIPYPGEFGYETWSEDAWETAGGANAWGGMSLDAERGLVFLATGSPAFDFYGAGRPGRNLFGNSVVALDAATGRRVWHFQAVHHDLWDYDLPCPPNLVTVVHEGDSVDAVAQVTKMGFVFLLDRETGEPLFEVEERPVPTSDVEGEVAYATQPFPTKPPPFVRQGFTEEDLTERTEEAHRYALERFEQSKAGPIYTPPSREGTIVFPGFRGGANWSGAAFDPATGMLYVNANEVPNLMTLVDAEPDAGYPLGHTGYNQFLDEEGYPAVEPPWGTLSAIDLNAGEIAWQKPLGAFPELLERGLPPTGTENLGGVVVTAGGLVFVGSTKDEKFRAFDKATGEVLWETKLPAGGYAPPATYEANGRQYVVIAAGGGGKMGTPSGDAYVAFALPE